MTFAYGGHDRVRHYRLKVHKEYFRHKRFTPEAVQQTPRRWTTYEAVIKRIRELERLPPLRAEPTAFALKWRRRVGDSVAQPVRKRWHWRFRQAATVLSAS